MANLNFYLHFDRMQVVNWLRPLNV